MMRCIARPIVASLLAAAGLTLPARAQVITIPGTPSCPRCTIAAESLFTLGAVTDSIRPTSFGNVERDSRGRFYAITDDHRVVIVFDPRGKLIGSIGRRGQGPGEFAARLWSIRVGAGDTLYVGGDRQISLFDRDWRFVRRLQLPASVSTFYPLAGGRFVGGMLIAAQDPRRPFHVFGPDGTVERSFGPEQPAPRGRNGGPPSVPRPSAHAVSRFVLASDAQSIWVDAREYAIERWGLDGRLLQRYVVNAPWMERGRESERDSIVRGTSTLSWVRKGVPTAEFLGSDAAGRFWYGASIPVPGTIGREGAPQPRTRLHEIVDLAAGRMILSTPTTKPFYLIRGSDLAVSGETNEDDESILSVWRVALRQP